MKMMDRVLGSREDEEWNPALQSSCMFAFCTRPPPQ